TYLISAVFRKNQHFFKGYGKIFLNSLGTYKKIFVQDENSLGLLQQRGIKHAEAAGDTRFDRVMQITKVKTALTDIDRFCSKSTVLVAGSTWSKDAELVVSAYVKLKDKNPGLKLILVPHEVDESSINNTEKIILEKNSTLFFARYTSKQNFERHDILIIDTIGLLSQLYRFGVASYVGGGFTDGIHSILEAMAHGVPVAFGPHNYKFIEAQEAKKLEIGREVHNEAELLAYFSEMISPGKAKTLSVKIDDYMRSKTGATEKICKEILV
ncbi:MAG: 3-deoxy-D-manno-octulosonic acid transferase, partial [Bacteroidia bacterium]